MQGGVCLRPTLSPPPPSTPLLSPHPSSLQSKCHPQTIEVVKTRADGLGLVAVVVDEDKLEFGKDVCGVLLQYPATDGTIDNYKV